MSSLFLTIGWIVWACAAFTAITFIFWSRRKAQTGQTYTWPTAIFGLSVWMLAIIFLFTSWDKLHLLWLLPTAFVGSSILFFTGVPIIGPFVLLLTNVFMRLLTIGIRIPNQNAPLSWNDALERIIDGKDAGEIKCIAADFLIPDNIIPIKFNVNWSVLLDPHSHAPNRHRQSGPTPSLEKFYSVVDRPPGFPKWFLAAYPDVASWVSEQENMQSFFHKIFGKVAEDQLLDGEQYLKREYLRGLVDTYRKNIADRLECGT